MTDRTEPKSTDAAPFTLRFTEWRCGHHGTRPDDIPVHSIEQAQAIVNAIGHAISQPGNARAALFNNWAGTSIYLTDGYADPIQKDWRRWAPRTTIHYATQEEMAELAGLQAAAVDYYGSALQQWDGAAYLDEMEVVTTLTTEAIEAAVAPMGWYEADRRRVVCEVPPIVKPAAELLAQLREVAQELAEEAARSVEGGEPCE